MSGNNRKVIIFEIHRTHQDHLYTLSVLALKAGFQVVAFVTRDAYIAVLPLIKEYHDQIEWHIQEETDGFVRFLLKIQNYVNRNGECVLFVNPLYDASLKLLVSFLLFSVKRPMYLGSGRTYTWFESDAQWPVHKEAVKLPLRKFILRKFDGLVIHSRDYFEYLRKRGYQRKILFLPWYLKEMAGIDISTYDSRKHAIVFGVAGSINLMRRDYFGLLGVFESLWSKGYVNFQLDLIGAPAGKNVRSIIERCESLQQKRYPLRFGRRQLDMETYLDRVSRSDCLIAPMKVEYYPHTQSSAVATEQIRFGKVAVLPADYRIPELESSTLYYRDIDDLERLLTEHFSDWEQIKRLARAAIENSRKFTFEAYVDEFRSFVIE